ncbi:MAG: hypothetical protein LBK99_17235 [Opitutaceae bacterium]|jgi:DNA-directed RNA polymerase specialized sigma24 family protein|nr:hypothetical protein [Opitutaceae bacterium]
MLRYSGVSEAPNDFSGLLWDHLLRHYQRPLYAYINDLVRDEAASLDLVQETFIRAVRHLPENLLGDNANSLENFHDASLPPPGERLLREEDAAELFAAVARLAPSNRGFTTRAAFSTNGWLRFQDTLLIACIRKRGRTPQ